MTWIRRQQQAFIASHKITPFKPVNKKFKSGAKVLHQPIAPVFFFLYNFVKD